VRRTWTYAATTKDEGNTADGRFSAACEASVKLKLPLIKKEGRLISFGSH